MDYKEHKLEEGLSFTQKKHNYRLLHIRQKKEMLNFSLKEWINLSGSSLLKKKKESVTLPKKNNNHYNFKNIYLIYKVEYRTNVIKNNKITFYPPITTIQHINNDIYYFQTWHCFYIIDIKKEEIINASIILRKVDEVMISPYYFEHKGILIKKDIVVFQYGKSLLLYKISDISKSTLLKFTQHPRHYYSFNDNTCLLNNCLEIMKIDNHCNPHIYYCNLDASCIRVYVNAKQEIILSQNDNNDEFEVHNKKQKTVHKITKENYYIKINDELSKLFYISKTLPVFQKFSCKIKIHQLIEIASSREIIGIKFKRTLYICNSTSIIYKIPFEYESIKCITEINNQLYIYSKRLLVIFDENSYKFTTHYSETIQYEIFKYKGNYTYIIISPISITIKTISNEIIKTIDFTKHQPIKRAISFKNAYLLILSLTKGIILWSIEQEKVIKIYEMYDLPDVHPQRELFDYESPTTFSMITDSILLLRRIHFDNVPENKAQNYLLDLSSFNNSIIPLNEKATVVKFLSPNKVILSIDDEMKLFTFPFQYPSKAVLIHKLEDKRWNIFFDVFPLRDGRLILSLRFGIYLLNYLEHKEVELYQLIKHIDNRIAVFRIISVYEYKDNVVLIRDIGGQTALRKEGHVYALDLNNFKFLYSLNPKGCHRYCFIFEPLKRMNVALSFDLAYLEIWNLDTVQCNTKIFMFETQRVFELDNCQLVLISKRGIRVVNAKY